MTKEHLAYIVADKIVQLPYNLRHSIEFCLNANINSNIHDFIITSISSSLKAEKQRCLEHKILFSLLCAGLFIFSWYMELRPEFVDHSTQIRIGWSIFAIVAWWILSIVAEPVVNRHKRFLEIYALAYALFKSTPDAYDAIKHIPDPTISQLRSVTEIDQIFSRYY